MSQAQVAELAAVDSSDYRRMRCAWPNTEHRSETTWCDVPSSQSAGGHRIILTDQPNNFALTERYIIRHMRSKSTDAMGGFERTLHSIVAEVLATNVPQELEELLQAATRLRREVSPLDSAQINKWAEQLSDDVADAGD